MTDVNDFLIILTSGGQIVLFALYTLLFFRPLDNEPHKRGLFRVAGYFYLVLFLQAVIYALSLIFFSDWVYSWRHGFIINLQAIPFASMIFLELVHAEDYVNGRMVLRYISIPLTLMTAYLLTCSYAPAVSSWFFCAFVAWVIIYLISQIPVTIRLFRQYEQQVREIYVDVENRSLKWVIWFVIIVFFTLMLYMVCLFKLSALTTWVYNLASIVIFTHFGNRIYRMRSHALVQVNDSDIDPYPEAEQLPEPATDNADPSSDEQFMHNLQAWLCSEDHLRSQDLNREMVAHAMQVSHIELARILRSQAGMTLAQYVRELRLSEAERLLVNTRLTIEEIYTCVGFQSRNTFNRAFQERHFCTASEWRDNMTQSS